MAYGGGDPSLPPQYEDVFAHHSSVGGLLTYVDFIPQCLDNPVFGNPKYEPFPVLMERANQYLARYPAWEAKTCESIEFKCKYGSRVNPEKMTYLERGHKGGTYFIRGLRLWIVPRLVQYPQQLGYVNVIPKIVKERTLGWPDFQSLNEMLQEFNDDIRKNPNIIPGKIITIETQEMKTRSSDYIKPDKSCWYEHAEAEKRFIVVIRVFYERYIDTLDTKDREIIGVADFKPTLLEAASFSRKGVYEPFSNVIQAASSWCSQQGSIRYCNAQTYEVKVKIDNTVDTQRMSYTEHGKSRTYYVRILRLAYVTLTGDRVAPPLNLTCKNFPPMMTKMCQMGVDEFESLSETRARIEEWLRVTGAKVLSCETAAMRMTTGGERKMGLEASFTYNHGNRDEHWLYVIRLFLDGHYAEPPAEVLSPPPKVEEESCVLL